MVLYQKPKFFGLRWFVVVWVEVSIVKGMHFSPIIKCMSTYLAIGFSESAENFLAINGQRCQRQIKGLIENYPTIRFTWAEVVVQ